MVLDPQEGDEQEQSWALAQGGLALSLWKTRQ